MGFPDIAVVKNMPAYKRCKRCSFDPWARKIPFSRKWQSIPVYLPGKPYGQRGLVGYSPWDHKKADTTGYACVHTHTCAHTHT